MRLALSLAALAAAITCAPRPARAIVVERVVAVVGDRPILKSELHTRARPFLIQIAQRVPPGPQQTAAESTVFQELLQKMVDEELEIQAADKAKVTVSADEIDSALHNVATSQGLTTADLMKGAIKSGLTEQEYREEMRRQILEFKMLQLRVKGRVHITEDDVKAMYERTVREERKRREYRPRWIVLRIPHGSSRDAMAEREALARDLVRRARGGEDFGGLAKRYSDDTATRDTGGDLGVKAPQGSPQATAGKRPVLSPDLDAAVMLLEPGQVTDPIHVADAIVIVEVAERQPSHYTTYDAAKAEMLQRLQSEILDKAKRKWLDELKARTHLDVRL
jgi:peptidyl-prolyl cis-trans isomerase SurA